MRTQAEQGYSEYADGVSPPLSWQSVPGARSCALIMEDPDARPYRRFVHWPAWNIPAGVTALPEGLQEQLFALDTVLDLPFGADREQLVAAVQGHVLASGMLVGRYAQKDKPPK